jgi:uncharacterized RmlC-like cupin family protein
MSSGSDVAREIVTVRGGDAFGNKQRLNLFEGISDRTCGSRGISMYKVVIPPGGRAEPHSHRGYETAIFVLKGEIETRYGAGLAKKVVNVAGDFLFIPADVPHQPVNIGTETAEAIVARNDASEQENVAPYDID